MPTNRSKHSQTRQERPRERHRQPGPPYLDLLKFTCLPILLHEVHIQTLKNKWFFNAFFMFWLVLSVLFFFRLKNTAPTYPSPGKFFFSRSQKIFSLRKKVTFKNKLEKKNRRKHAVFEQNKIQDCRKTKCPKTMTKVQAFQHPKKTIVKKTREKKLFLNT